MRTETSKAFREWLLEGDRTGVAYIAACPTCRALLPNDPEDLAAHAEWHETAGR